MLTDYYCSAWGSSEGKVYLYLQILFYLQDHVQIPHHFLRAALLRALNLEPWTSSILPKIAPTIVGISVIIYELKDTSTKSSLYYFTVQYYFLKHHLFFHLF